nr:response regulator [Chitinophagales bacterium]
NEDSPADAGLLLHELDTEPKRFITEVVETEEEFIKAINEFNPDLILSDFSQPFFDGVSAFKVASRLVPHIPFIIVSGTIGEELAVDLIKQGVVDYALKSKLYSLLPKIERALAEAKEKQAKLNAELELKKLNSDLEERIEARTRELTEANRALESFSHSVSHDLYGPLRSILGFTQIIQKDYGQTFNDDVKGMFGHIEKSCWRMNTLIKDLLAFSKHGLEKMEPTTVDMNSLFSRVWDDILFSAPHKATLKIEDLPAVKGDASLLEQVVVNLLRNAIKYSAKAEKPVVLIGSSLFDGKVTFYIKDNGAGFDMKDYHKLFGAFQRLHVNREFEGTGLGLNLVKRIIERHGGTVSAEGKVGEGATFYFTLPA